LLACLIAWLIACLLDWLIPTMHISGCIVSAWDVNFYQLPPYWKRLTNKYNINWIEICIGSPVTTSRSRYLSTHCAHLKYSYGTISKWKINKIVAHNCIHEIIKWD
jgi:hypothetical protein